MSINITEKALKLNYNYVYLLQEREFIKSEENIYKIGKTKCHNMTRFNNYPKGCLLLYYSLCNDCDKIEMKIKKVFQKKFVHRKEYGSEYFEGDCKNMVELIHGIVWKSLKMNNDNKIYRNRKQDTHDKPYEIKTYEDFIKYTSVQKIIITERSTCEGYIVLNNGEFKPLYSNNEKIEDSLEGYIKLYEHVHNVMFYNDKLIDVREYELLSDTDKNNVIYYSVEFNCVYVMEDILNKCYVKNLIFYDLKNYEYFVTHDTTNKVGILNTRTFTIKKYIDDKNNQILGSNKLSILHFNSINNMDGINVQIVDQIMSSLINDQKQLQIYKSMCKHILCDLPQNKCVIFYDYYKDCPLLSIWIKNVINKLTSCYGNTRKIYQVNDICNFKNARVGFIDPCEECVKIHTTRQNYIKFGIKNIIITHNNNVNNIYNYESFFEYLRKNINLINGIITKQNFTILEDMNPYDMEVLFTSSDMMLINYLKWCYV